MVDAALWWTGLATWLLLTLIGLLAVFDLFLDRVINAFWSRKECMAFVWSRMRARQSADEIQS